MPCPVRQAIHQRNHKGHLVFMPSQMSPPRQFRGSFVAVRPHSASPRPVFSPTTGTSDGRRGIARKRADDRPHRIPSGLESGKRKPLPKRAAPGRNQEKRICRVGEPTVTRANDAGSLGRSQSVGVG